MDTDRLEKEAEQARLVLSLTRVYGTIGELDKKYKSDIEYHKGKLCEEDGSRGVFSLLSFLPS